MRMEFKGGRAIEKAFDELGNAASTRLGRRVLRKGAAIPIRDKARQLAPKDELVLEEAIEEGTRLSGPARRAVGRDGPEQVRVYVGINQDGPQEVNIYSRVQEEGNEDTPAQPYFRPAFNREGKRSIPRIGEMLWDDIKRTAKRMKAKAMKG